MATNFLLLDSGPVIDPGKCGICGYAGSDRVFTDPQKHFEFYGTFIICELCVGAMAQDYGFIEPVRALAIEQRAKEAEQRLLKLAEALGILEKLRDLVGDFDFGNGDADPEPVVSVDSAPEFTEPEQGDSDAPILDSTEGREDGESKDGEGSGDSETDLAAMLQRSNVLSNFATSDAAELDL